MTSDLMIADVTAGNPNVFYEVGIGQTLSRDLVLITQDEDIPFDVQAQHTVFCSSDDDGLGRLKRGLIQSIGQPPAR
jgi:hypothetical protein